MVKVLVMTKVVLILKAYFSAVQAHLLRKVLKTFRHIGFKSVFTGIPL